MNEALSLYWFNEFKGFLR